MTSKRGHSGQAAQKRYAAEMANQVYRRKVRMSLLVLLRLLGIQSIKEFAKR